MTGADDSSGKKTNVRINIRKRNTATGLALRTHIRLTRRTTTKLQSDPSRDAILVGVELSKGIESEAEQLLVFEKEEGAATSFFEDEPISVRKFRVLVCVWFELK